MLLVILGMKSVIDGSRDQNQHEGSETTVVPHKRESRRQVDGYA